MPLTLLTMGGWTFKLTEKKKLLWVKQERISSFTNTSSTKSNYTQSNRNQNNVENNPNWKQYDQRDKVKGNFSVKCKWDTGILIKQEQKEEVNISTHTFTHAHSQCWCSNYFTTLSVYLFSEIKNIAQFTSSINSSLIVIKDVSKMLDTNVNNIK